MPLSLQHPTGTPSPIISAIIICLGFALLVTPRRFLPGINRHPAGDSGRSHPRLFGAYLVLFGCFLLALHVQKSGSHKEVVVAGYVIGLFVLAVLAFLLFAFLAAGVIFIRYPNEYNARLRKLGLVSMELKPEPTTLGTRIRLRIVGIVFVAAAFFLAYLVFRIL